MPRHLRHPDRLGLHLRVVLNGGIVIGPGRAELLEAIREHGSISAAGRAMSMSYKRAWDLIEEMNTTFKSPVVETSIGGQAGGGSTLTASGEAALAAYRQIETLAADAAAAPLRALNTLLVPPAGKTRKP